MKVIARNKKAFFDYEIFDKIEAGISLTGDEVKSIRAGNVNLGGSYATVHGGELFLLNCNISVYDKAYSKDSDLSTRSRKLLVHKKELNRLIGEVSRRGMTIVPLQLYFNKRNLAKVQIGLCKHRKASGKKQLLKERDIERATKRELKEIHRS